MAGLMADGEVGFELIVWPAFGLDYKESFLKLLVVCRIGLSKLLMMFWSFVTFSDK